jgi:hypothetical protein
MPYVNIKVTKEGVTAEQKAKLIPAALLDPTLRGNWHLHLFDAVEPRSNFYAE